MILFLVSLLWKTIHSYLCWPCLVCKPLGSKFTVFTRGTHDLEWGCTLIMQTDILHIVNKMEVYVFFFIFSYKGFFHSVYSVLHIHLVFIWSKVLFYFSLLFIVTEYILNILDTYVYIITFYLFKDLIKLILLILFWFFNNTRIVNIY